MALILDMADIFQYYILTYCCDQSAIRFIKSNTFNYKKFYSTYIVKREFTDVEFKTCLEITKPPHPLPLITSFRYTNNITNNPVCPISMNSLKFDYDELIGFNPIELLPSITFLRLPFDYNRPLPIGLLPISLVSLEFGKNFNKPFLDQIGISSSSSLTSIKYGYSFNQSFPTEVGILPSSLKSLDFNYAFNQPFPTQVGILPSSLTSLKFDSLFDHPFPTEVNILPSSLTELEIVGNFNQPFPTLMGILPPSLLSLHLVGVFNQPFPIEVGILPASLTELKLGFWFNQPLPTQVGILPSSLKTLIFGKDFDQPFPTKIDILPSSLTRLEFGDYFNQPFPTEIGIIPSSLTDLKIGFCFNQQFPTQIGIIPISLTHLTLECHSKYINMRVILTLLPNLTYLRVHNGYEKIHGPVSVNIPNNIKEFLTGDKNVTSVYFNNDNKQINIE